MIKLRYAEVKSLAQSHIVEMVEVIDLSFMTSILLNDKINHTLNPYDPPGLHPQYSWKGDGFATNNSQSPWQAAPTGHLCFWPLSQHQWAGQGYEHCPNG